MKAYGITKYRNLKGEIAEQEWISISDIGRSFGGVFLCDYLIIFIVGYGDGNVPIGMSALIDPAETS